MSSQEAVHVSLIKVTVYALDILLKLPSSQNFPPTAETLFQALIQAGRNHHILQSASITGLYSTTPPE